MNKRITRSMAWILALLLALSIVFTGCDTGAEITLPATLDDNQLDNGADGTTKPTEEPELPSVDPEGPSDDPAEPNAKPDGPVETPDTPTDQPDNPTDQPDNPGDQPGGSTDVPETPADPPAPPVIPDGDTGGTDSGNTDSAQKNAEKELGVPQYSGSPYAEVNNNVPSFGEDEITTQSYEFYSALDSLGRCGYTEACIGLDIMPTEPRGDISSIKPTGWINKMYSAALVDGGSLYNRCHLIGFQLTGENANNRNLITGTRYMNADGMLPFENMIADYVKESGNHVMYRVTPIFDGNDLVACGVHMEAYSVEDNGEGISFNVYMYNVQPGIVIDYATGDNWLAEGSEDVDTPVIGDDVKYILNTSKKKIHEKDCPSVQQISPKNYQEYSGDIEDLLEQGYKPCGSCKPEP